MSNIIDDIRSEATRLEQYAAFVATVQAATGIGGMPATEILAIIKAALTALAQGATGAMSSEQILAEFAKLTSGEAADDAAAQAAIGARWPTPAGQ